MKDFPFPDKVGSREELSRDILSRKIEPGDMQRIADAAWDIGVQAMQLLQSEYPGRGIAEMCEAMGLEIVHEARDNVAGNVRFFSEYYSGKKRIVLYDKAIRLWAEANKLNIADAEELILSHEVFHHLECTKLGLTSDIYKVPWIGLGKLSIGQCGIRALSEIGAHGFSRTYYDKTGRVPTGPDPNDEEENHATPRPETNRKLQNHAMDEAGLRASRGMKAFAADNALLRMLTGAGKNRGPAHR